MPTLISNTDNREKFTRNIKQSCVASHLYHSSIISTDNKCSQCHYNLSAKHTLLIDKGKVVFCFVFPMLLLMSVVVVVVAVNCGVDTGGGGVSTGSGGGVSTGSGGKDLKQMKLEA